MNRKIKDLIQIQESPKVSLFLEWKSMGHNFDEFRIWLRNIQSEMSRKDLKVPESILTIMEDAKVFGRELKIQDHLRLGDKYGAFYFSGNHQMAFNTHFRSKDQFFLDDQFFVLPLLKSPETFPVLALSVHLDQVRAFQVDHYHDVAEITSAFEFPESPVIEGRERMSEQRSHNFSGRNASEVAQDHDEEMVRRYMSEIADEVLRNFEYIPRVHLFGSPKVTHVLEDQLKKRNRKAQVESHSYITSSKAPEIRKAIQEMVSTRENFESFKDLKSFRTEPVTDLKEVIWSQEMGNLARLHINQFWLSDALGKGEDLASLKALNRFVVSCLDGGVDVQLSANMEDLIAGELRGQRVRPPQFFENPSLEMMEQLKY